MNKNLPYRKEIDLSTLVKEEINKAIEVLGMRNDEDLTVEVEMGTDLILIIQIGPENPGILQ